MYTKTVDYKALAEYCFKDKILEIARIDSTWYVILAENKETHLRYAGTL